MRKKANIVLEAIPLSNFRLFIRYLDGQARIYDFMKSPFWAVGDFIGLINLDEFIKVKPVFNTIEWDCGVTISPEELYNDSYLCDLSHLDTKDIQIIDTYESWKEEVAATKG